MWWIIGFTVLLAVVWIVAMHLFPHRVTLKEGLIMLVIQTCVISAIIFGSLYGQGSDVQILNGEVTGKSREEVSCSHSYSCNCRTTCSGSGSSRTCSQVCQTCYEHNYDVEWNVQSSIGYHTEIATIDRQGLKEPPRWSSVKIGEPFAVQDSYYNYIKASPFSIFNKSELDNQVTIPAYLSVHDYYRINRVIDFDSDYKPSGELNNLLNYSLRKLGTEKKVNVVVVLHSKGNLFSESLRARTLGGKINDVYLVLGVDKEGDFKHVAVFSWSKSDVVNVKLRDALLEIGKYDAVAINKVVQENILQYYEPRSIEDFKYLDDEVEVPTYAIWMVMIFGILFPFGSAYIAYRHEIA